MRIAILAAALAAATPALADTVLLTPEPVVEWKPVYGRVEARDLVPARARIGGTLAELLVTEGDEVAAGARIAVVRDDKLAFEIAALDAQLRALEAQLIRARTELERGRSLIERGVTTAQRLEQLTTDVDVTLNQIAATEAQRAAVIRQEEEGEVLSPAAGRVLTVPTTRDAVVMPGEPVATIAGGGLFLRLAIPERHAADLAEGAEIRITAAGAETTGTLVKLYPRIENGRVVADVEVEDLADAFVDARVLVEVPVGRREALLVPRAALVTRSGLDFVRVIVGGGSIERAVVPGDTILRDGTAHVEILTGLQAGETVAVP
ncbi:MAG: efflux RND transporter periplasmic adaptor subunit [Gemmobacter sp.]